MANSNVPKVAAEYQSIVDPDGGVTDKITAPAPHFDTDVFAGAIGSTFTVNDVATVEVEVHELVVPDFIEFIVIVVLPEFGKLIVVKLPVPAVVTTIFGEAVPVFVPLKVYATA